MASNNLFQLYNQTIPPNIDTGTRIDNFFEDNDYNKYFSIGKPMSKPIDYSYNKSEDRKEYYPYLEQSFLNDRTMYSNYTASSFIDPSLSSFSADSSLIATPHQTKIVDTARRLIGTKYTYGGTTPTTGFDCSGFVNYVYQQNGIDLGARTVKDLEHIGQEVSLNNVKLGDLICLSSSSSPSGKHIKIVSRIDENGQIWTIEAKGKKYGVVEEPLNTKEGITTIRHINSTPAARKGLKLDPYTLFMKSGGKAKEPITIRWQSSMFDSVEEAINDFYNQSAETKEKPKEKTKQLAPSSNYQSLRQNYIDKLENPNNIGFDPNNDRWTPPPKEMDKNGNLKWDINQIGYGLDINKNSFVVNFLKENGRTDNPWLTMSEMRHLQKQTFDDLDGVISRNIDINNLDDKVKAMMFGLVYHGYGKHIWNPNGHKTRAIREAINNNDAKSLYYAIYNLYKGMDPQRAQRHLEYWKNENW